MKTIYLVPHAHYDVVWAMTKEDYVNIHKKLLRQALEMIHKSDFKFIIEQTHLLEQVESDDPQLFSEIESAILDGQIEIVDGEYLMPDPMIPAEEVLVREILIGKMYCKDKFGIEVPVAWMSDGFGLNAQLPQIYKKSGYKWLAFRRGLPKSIGMRASEFQWEGIDGTRIPAHWMPLGYRAGLDLSKWDESYSKLEKLATTQNILMPCGSGGMLIQEDIPKAVENWNNSNRKARMVIATPREFFEAVQEEGEPSTVFRGELYSSELEDIFPDVVSSRISLKLAIRECEDLIKSIEKAAALAYLQGNRYPQGRLADSWRKMLFLAFHDVMPSCGIDEIYDEAWQYVSDIKKMASSFYHSAVNSLPMDQVPGIGIMVFNPHSWKITDWVEVDLRLGTGWSKEPGVYFNEKEVVSEARDIERWDDGSIQHAKLGFVATVPPLGYRIYEVRPASKQFKSKKIKIKENDVSTRFFDLRIDPDTGIIEVFDKEGSEILKGNEVVIDAELGDLYFHKSYLDQCIGSESGEGIRFGAFKPQEPRIEKGPLRTVISFTNSYHCLRWPYYLTDKFESILHRHNTLDIVKRVIVYNDIPRIDFFTELDSRQSHIRVRLRFDTCMAAPVYTRETQFGAIELPHARTMEEGVKMPSLTWLSAEDGERGLAFLSKGVPINEVRGGEIYCTLLRSVSVLSADGVSGPLIPTPGALELGKHTYYYSVYPHKGDWRSARVPREAYRFGEGLVGFQVDRLATPREYETFRLQPDNLIVSAVKKAESEEALILRFFETDGQACRAKLRTPPNIRSVSTVNLLEEEIKDENNILFRKSNLELDVRPFEIVTLKMLF
ncbi:MAG: glycoside hydrolase [Candidatus Latescibacteria bacterium]|nr:glycoside hydrolase [Candidatus Latescibacterota bacterium]NIM64427.1 glycoside hydrolase [Candidatus Latescibacterota bacterium]NIO00581.1 glycoside hydrolase [Candidatus Latescibacterota bacterium]NIO26981.1 glycoside hydrolase [Candidatus Latescibacterota bacterium]NIO56058.1 glycoside hydrolase [Candidatus Latescibacterota bacterium]